MYSIFCDHDSTFSEDLLTYFCYSAQDHRYIGIQFRIFDISYFQITQASVKRARNGVWTKDFTWPYIRV